MPSGGRGAPKPGPPPEPQRWFQERSSSYAWEQDGLDHIRCLMPAAEPYRAWATFSFTASNGRVNECDLLIAVPRGLYLVELKGHPGDVVNNGDTWTFHQQGAKHPRTLRNPLHLTDLKCKELKSRLEWVTAHTSQRIPWIEPAVFLHAPGLRSGLDEVQAANVYGRDESCEGLPWIWRDLLGRPPQREDRRVTGEFSRQVLPELLKKIGIRSSTAHLRFGDEWTLAPEKLDAGPTWEDRLAERSGIVAEEGRVRIYLTEQQAGEEHRASVERAARREYQVLQGMTHRGIAQAVQIREHEAGPAILFRHRASDERLDSYLAVHGEELSPETRLDMVRQLGEALAYAHGRSLYHRALAARSVYVSAGSEGDPPVLRIIDWQAAARDFDTGGASSIGNTSLSGEHVSGAAEVYLAPEYETPYPDPVDLDVFGLGALSYLVLTGQPPATQRSGLIERLQTEQGLHPYAVTDGVSDSLDALVFHATRAQVAERLDSAEAFLHGLDEAEADTGREPVAGVDPLQATPGQAVDADWVVARVLGAGATARALLLTREAEDEAPLEERRRVLKVALDEGKAATLHAEADALERVGGGTIVQLLGGPRTLGGRTVLDLEYACGYEPGGAEYWGRTLGAVLRDEGKLSYHNLQRYGTDLFRALDQLAGKVVRHRDLKPDNFGVYRRADRSTQLMLFDFSLAGASEKDVKAGTRGYLDPFLGTPRRPVFDDHAERYAAAVTLHEMASAQCPTWGDGMSDPRTAEDETPEIAADVFDAALRDELTAFFHRALHRDTDRRFDTLPAMEEAWRAVFTNAEAAAPATTPATVGIEAETLAETRDAHAEAASADTPLDAAGLTPNAVSVAHSFGASTVGELLDVPQYQIAKARGAGARVRKELNRRHKQWARALRQMPSAALPAAGGHTIDDLAALLDPGPGRKNSSKADVLRLTLVLPNGEAPIGFWPTQSEVAGTLGITQASVSRHLRDAVKAWAGLDVLTGVREELVALVAGAGRVMTARELAAALRARRGAVEDTPEAAAARALAVVRAAVEAETWPGLNDADDEAGPRMAMLRREPRVLIAAESLHGSDEPSAPELSDYARNLGACADELVGTEPLPGRGAVVRALRAVPTPEGQAMLADTRLVELAATVSQHAAASPRLELYPRELDLARALRISQAAAGARPDRGLTVEALLERVRARFPELQLDPPPTHVELEEALEEAGFGLRYEPGSKEFRAPERELSRLASSSATSYAGQGRSLAADLDPAEATHGKLASAIERGGFVALTLRGAELPGTAEGLAARYPVRSVDVDACFLAAFRALVTEQRQDWSKVLALDARFGESGQASRGLTSYVEASWQRVGERLAEQAAEPSTVLFLHHASLLARYFEQGGRELLAEWQHAARLADRAPHGLWLLCPGEAARDTPRLDGRTVEVIGEAERVVLAGEFLDGLRGVPGSAA